MSTLLEYDSGPLSWVKGEIDQALQKTAGTLTQFNIGQDDPAQLRQARTHLHQVTGAIGMVGLQGVALVCQEAERLVEGLERQSVPLNEAALDLLRRTLDGVGHYLDGLLKGRPNLELRLFPLYRELRATLGAEQSQESDLFFPDLGQRAPRNPAAQPLSEAELAALLKKSRIQFQRGLLGFLRQQNADQGLAAMRAALHDIEQAMALPANRTFWWGATAFVDCLINHAIEPDFAVKQLCGRIDLQMRRLAEGSYKVAERLLRDILYFVAQSGEVSEQVAEVKRTFALDTLMPATEAESGELAKLQPLLKELRVLLAPAKESWLKFSAGNRDSLFRFQAQITALQGACAPMKSTPVQRLLEQIGQVAADLPGLPAGRTDAVGLEVATALLLIQNTLENYEHVTGELVQQAEVQAQRLRAAAYGDIDPAQIADVPLLDEMSRQAQERLLIAQVAIEVQANLQQVEEVLDSFFRDPHHERQALSSLLAPIAQVQGALSMLQLDHASQVLQAARELIREFSAATGPVDESKFPLLADSLSSLGLYIDALRYQRSDAEAVLAPVLRLLGLVEEDAAPPPAPRAEADEQSIEAGLDTLKLDLHRQLVAWQQTPAEAHAQEKLLDTLHELSQDAELISDQALKSQAEDALRLAHAGPNGELAHAIHNLSGVGSVPPPDAAVPEEADSAVDAELLAIFLEEATEVLDTIASQLTSCRANPLEREALTTIRRGFHTLKGSGRMVRLTDLGEVAWRIEQLLNQWLQDDRPAAADLLDLLEEAHSQFSHWVDALKSRGHASIAADHLMTWADELRSGTAPQSAVPASFETETAMAAPDIPAPAPLADPAATEQLATAPALTDLAVAEPVALAATPVSLEPAAAQPEADTQAPAPPADDRITIGANLISTPLLDIFLREAQQHYATLHTEFARLLGDPSEAVSYDFMRAAHTLAGIAATTGFTPVAELAHALEVWLNQLHEAALPLPANNATAHAAIETLGDMLHAIRALQAPAPAHDLIAAFETAAAPVAPQQAATDTHAGEWEHTPEWLPQAPDSQTGAVSHAMAGHTEVAPLATQPDFADLSAVLAAAGEQPARRNIQDDLDEQLLPIFLEEAAELMPKINQESRNWRAAPEQGEAPASLQRLLHTLKGSARMAGAMRLGELTHIMETQVAAAVASATLSAADFDTFDAELDRLNDAVQQLRGPAAGAQVAAQTQPASAPETPAEPGHAPVLATLPVEPESSAQMLRVRADTVDRLVNEAGEISIARSRLESSVAVIRQGAGELAENITRLRTQLRELEIQAESQMQSTLSHMQQDDQQFDPLEFDRFTRLQELTRMIAESVNDVGTVQQNLAVALGETDAALTQQGRMTRDLQQSLMRIRMVPLSSVADRLHRTVRRAAKELGKKASLQIVGEQVELDRGVLEKMVAPFEHLLRNAVAHGLETPAERIAAGKSEYGEIVLHARQEGNEIMLTLRDDGRGLDLDAIHARAIAHGLLQAEMTLAPAQLMQFIFMPGFSTAQQVTELSGRGIGMDVVKSEITGLGGRIEVSSEADRGAQFTVHLPLTLAVTQTVLVSAAGHLYALPSAMVEQVQEFKPEALAQLFAEGRVEWQGNRYDFFYLPHLVGETGHLPPAQRYSPVILLRSGNLRTAILVDHLTGNREVVVKNIGPQLARVSGIAGATVLGNGQVVLILNPVQLAQRHGEHARQASSGATAAAAPRVTAKKMVMVVDDSLTVRKIASRMLAREGYEVITAKDGVDALQALQDMVPDVMLLDIEMPRMDGFELTRTMRADARLAEVPIIMITSRTADKHREHAFKLGINAYLGKPYQEDELLARIAELADNRATAPA